MALEYSFEMDTEFQFSEVIDKLGEAPDFEQIDGELVALGSSCFCFQTR